MGRKEEKEEAGGRWAASAILKSGVCSACDFVCFRGRWDISEVFIILRDTILLNLSQSDCTVGQQHSFRPPYYHRNAATEFNAVIRLDTPYSGFADGVHWLTPLHTPHGIGAATYNGFMDKVDEEQANTPRRLSDDSLWIMFESCCTSCGAFTTFCLQAYRYFFSLEVTTPPPHPASLSLETTSLSKRPLSRNDLSLETTSLSLSLSLSLGHSKRSLLCLENLSQISFPQLPRPNAAHAAGAGSTPP